MQNTLALRVALLSCCASAAMLPSVAIAQDGADPISGDPPIIVTATRRNELLKDVAMSVDVATGEDIEKLKIFDAKEIQQHSPGL